jgi:hypothetical protein
MRGAAPLKGGRRRDSRRTSDRLEQHVHRDVERLRRDPSDLVAFEAVGVLQLQAEREGVQNPRPVAVASPRDVRADGISEGCG